MKHNLLQFVAAVLALSTILRRCVGHELRPEEHGLEYQQGSSPPPQAQEMLSFFATTAQLPEEKNISDTWLSFRARDAGRDQVRLGLVVASAACTLTGMVLLAISGVVFIYRLRKEGVKADTICSTSAVTSLPTQNKITA